MCPREAVRAEWLTMFAVNAATCFFPPPAASVVSAYPPHAITCSQPGRGTLLAGFEIGAGSWHQNIRETAGTLPHPAGHLPRVAHGAGSRWCQRVGGAVHC